jgi:hypothetical protein
LPVVAAVSLTAAFVAQQATNSSAALNPINGALFAGATDASATRTAQSPTLPRGAVWVADTSAASGHWWVGDQLQGLCRLDSQAGNPGLGPFQLAGCSGIVKSGGQIAVGTVPGAPTQTYLYVADAAAKSTQVVRFTIANNVPTPTVTASLVFNVPNVTQKGGGLAGGRPVGLVLAAASATQDDLLVSYVKSGDVMRVRNVNNASKAIVPTVEWIGSTSDGLGVNSLAMMGNDLYLGEAGGLGGVSKIADPLGRTRPACSAASKCTAIGTGSLVGFPGGMASDGSRYLYVADTRTGGATNYLYRVDVTKNPVVTDMISNSVAPSVSALNSSQVKTAYSSYVFPLAVGYKAGAAGNPGTIIVGDDPQFLAAAVTNNQGHLWSLTAPPPPPAITSLSTTSGPANGGTVVTVTGVNLTAGAKVLFGTNPATGVVCTATSCTATSPAGVVGLVDVTVNVNGQVSATGPQDQFTYTPAVAPTIASVTPSTGAATGGDPVVITGTNFTTDGSTTFTFGGAAATGVSCSSATSCVATTPAGAGAAGVVATNGFGVSPTGSFNYVPSVTSLDVASGSSAGGTAVVVSGVGITPTSSVSFGAVVVPAACVPGSCSVTSPGGAVGVVDVRVTTDGQTSPVVAADQFTYLAAGGAAITSISPQSGAVNGGTKVTINGSGLTAGATVNFGAVAATNVVCTGSTCTAESPAGAAGPVSVTVTATDAAGVVTTSNPEQFTYVTPSAGLYAWGITAPKGGAVWIPGSLGGHWWSSDHAQGFCRQDQLPTSPLHAINYTVCGSDLVGSAGQAVYDSRTVTANGVNFPNLHYVYVPDNAVRSTAVWRLTVDSTTETLVADPIDGATMATAMTPLADVRTLKPNGMALGPLDAVGNLCTAATCPGATVGLYVTDLVDKYVRVISNPDGDPRTQTISLVAATGDGRGSNGTQGFIGRNLYISGNRATQFVDVTQCPLPGGTVCGMASVPAPTGIFVSGTTTDPVNGFVYVSNSPGGANANILRYNAKHDVYVAFPEGFYVPDANGVVTCLACTMGANASNFVSGGVLPGPYGAPVPIATGPAPIGGTRPWDTVNRPTLNATFSFAFGLAVGPSGELVITEDPSAGARSSRGTMWVVPFTG